MRNKYMLCLAIGIVINILSISSANAYLVNIDQFTITKNGNTNWSDSFDDGQPPVDGDAYNVNGVPGPEAGGKLTLDSANGGPHTSINGDPRVQTRVRRKTSTGSDVTRGLRFDDLFSVTGIFDTGSTISQREQYGVSFTDAVGSPTSDKLDLFVKHTLSGELMIQFRRQDNFNGVLTILEELAFVPGVNDQISLSLSRLNTGTNDITASFAYGLAGLFGTETILATTATIFNDVDFTRAQFTATGPSPVPVPAAVWLFASGLLGLLRIASRNRN